MEKSKVGQKADFVEILPISLNFSKKWKSNTHVLLIRSAFYTESYMPLENLKTKYHFKH